MQVAAKIAALDQRRQFPGLGRFDLASVFAQLGRNPIQPQRGVDVFFPRRGDRGAVAVKAVLVEQQSVLYRDPPQMDAVGLRAGEVYHRRAVALARHHAEIDVQAAAQRDAGLGFALGHNFRHARKRNQLFHHRGRLARYGQQIEIADRFLAPAKTARGLKPLDRAAFSHMGEQLLDHQRGVRIQRTHRGMLFQLGEMLEYLVLHFRPEAAQRSYRAGLRRSLEVRKVADLELLRQCSSPFRTKPRDAEQSDYSGRDLVPEFAMQGKLAGRQDGRDFAPEVSANPGQFVNRLGTHIGELGRAIADGAGGVAVGADAKEVVFADLDHVGDFVENVRDLVVLHRSPEARKRFWLAPPSQFRGFAIYKSMRKRREI